jgi:ATP-dependent Clp protease ATP-binding subunit ClpC
MIHGMYTDRMRKTMKLTHDEATRLCSSFVDVEHFLLGIIKEGGGVAVEFLKAMKIDLRVLAQRLEKNVAGEPSYPSKKIFFTALAKKVLITTDHEAQALCHHYIGTEHLLLAILKETESKASQILFSSGLTYDKTLEKIKEILRGNSMVISENNKDQKIAKILLTFQKQLVDNIDKANDYLLRGNTENFEKYKLIYQTIQECIDVITTEMKS